MVYHLITDRQADFVELACAGRTDDEIAEALGITKGSVWGHRYKVLTRLRLTTMAEVCAAIDPTVPRPPRLHERNGKRS